MKSRNSLNRTIKRKWLQSYVFSSLFQKFLLILILPQEGEYGLKKAKIYYELGKFFYQHKIPVPNIEFWDQKSRILIIEDLEDTKLSELKNPFLYYYKVIEILIKLQKLVSFFL